MFFSSSKGIGEYINNVLLGYRMSVENGDDSRLSVPLQYVS